MTDSNCSLSATVNAKINIGLHIVNKRPDGYHNIETVFYPTDFFRDCLSISKNEHGLTFTIDSDEDLGNADDNLCVKAFRLIQKDYGIPGADIQLRKGIPSGAGLGGGSADAAFTLKMLNELFHLDIPFKTLAEYALLLGSDVPFFLFNKPMCATGRGEILSPIDLDLSNYKLKIVKPDVRISTKEAYSGVTPQNPPISLRDALKKPVEQWKDLISNDFEKSLFAKYPELEKTKQDLYSEGAIYASMTGSGSAFFSISKKQ